MGLSEGFYGLPKGGRPPIVQKQSEPMPGAPDQEIDGDTMPEANHQHCTHLSDENNRRRWDFFIASQMAGEGIKKVSTEPLGQGDMPVVPKKGQIRLAIGLLEIIRQVEA